MNQGDMEKLARTVAKETVSEMFVMLGMDVSNPTAIQDQFAFLRYAFHGARHARNVVVTSVCGLIATGICWAVWAAVKAPAAASAVEHLSR